MLVQLQGNTGELDVLNWMGHAALEAIGRAGMGHSFISFAEGNTPSDAVMDAVKRFVLVSPLVSTNLSLVCSPCDHQTFNLLLVDITPIRGPHRESHHVPFQKDYRIDPTQRSIPDGQILHRDVRDGCQEYTCREANCT